MILAILIVIIFSDLNRKMSDTQKMEYDLAVLQTEVDELEAAHADLTARVTALAADDYVHEWAHTQARMVLPGEQLVIPISDSRSTPIPQRLVETQEPPEPWEVWRALILGR